MLHEDKVLQKHPKAKEFRPVSRAFRSNGMYGWIFEVPRDNGIGTRFGWVTFDGEVSSDLLVYSERAKQNLKAYVRSRANDKSPIQPALGVLEDMK